MLIFFPWAETPLNFAFFLLIYSKYIFLKLCLEIFSLSSYCTPKFWKGSLNIWLWAGGIHGWIHIMGIVRSPMLSVWLKKIIFFLNCILRILSFCFLVYGSFYISLFFLLPLQQLYHPFCNRQCTLVLYVKPVFPQCVAFFLVCCCRFADVCFLHKLCADECNCERGKILNRNAVS